MEVIYSLSELYNQLLEHYDEDDIKNKFLDKIKEYNIEVNSLRKFLLNYC